MKARVLLVALALAMCPALAFADEAPEPPARAPADPWIHAEPDFIMMPPPPPPLPWGPFGKTSKVRNIMFEGGGVLALGVGVTLLTASIVELEKPWSCIAPGHTTFCGIGRMFPELGAVVGGGATLGGLALITLGLVLGDHPAHAPPRRPIVVLGPGSARLAFAF